MRNVHLYAAVWVGMRLLTIKAEEILGDPHSDVGRFVLGHLGIEVMMNIQYPAFDPVLKALLPVRVLSHSEFVKQGSAELFTTAWLAERFSFEGEYRPSF